MFKTAACLAVLILSFYSFSSSQAAEEEESPDVIFSCGTMKGVGTLRVKTDEGFEDFKIICPVGESQFVPS